MNVQMSIPPPPPPPPPPGFFAEAPTSQFIPPPSVPAPPSEPFVAQAPTTNASAPTTQDRIWLHPWTASEMRQYASQWSMAGDAGLLLYLEQFSNTLVQRADAIQQHLNQTVNAVKSTHTRVENCLNEFTSLANTQFIENRVYDEDETVNTKESKKDEQLTEKTVSNSEAQEKVLQRYAEAVQCGLAILDTHFERVEAKLDSIQNGSSSLADDADDEDVGISMEPILEPKDPYIFRPLPFLIGTTEFMQDDFVGLGELLNSHEEDQYDVGPIKRVESYSTLGSSDAESEQSEVKVTPAPIVPAGASRPDLANQSTTSAQRKSSFTSDDDGDDIFGGNSAPSFVSNTIEKEKINDNVPKKPSTLDFDEDSEDDFIEPSIQNTTNPAKKDNSSNLFNDLSSNEPDEIEPAKSTTGVSMLAGEKKGMSELEKAVLNRRKKMLGADEVQSDDEADTEPKENIKKKVKPPIEESATSNISKLPSQSTPRTVTKTEKIDKPSIFGSFAFDDDKDNLFMDDPPLGSTKVNVSSTTKEKITPLVDSQPSIINRPKIEKTLFDDDDEDDDDPFAFTNKTTKKIESTSKVQPIPIANPKPIIKNDESDDDSDEILKPKPKPKSIPTPSKPPIEKPKSPSSEDDLFKPLMSSAATATTKISSKPRESSDDEDISSSKRSIPQPATSVIPSLPQKSVKKPTSLTDEDSNDEMFGIPKSKINKTTVQPVVLPPNPPVSNVIVENPVITKSDVTKTEIRKPVPTNKISDDDDDDDDDDGLFKKSSSKLPTIKSSSANKTNDNTSLVGSPALNNSSNVSAIATPKVVIDQDPLSGNTLQASSSKPTQTPIIRSEKKSISESNEEELSPEKQLNPTAVKDGEKPHVRDISKRLNFDPTRLMPGATKRKPVVEESPKPSVSDDDTPVVDSKPVPVIPVVKKSAPLDSDSDDDLFNEKKKEKATVSSTETKKNIDNVAKNVRVKNISSHINIPLMMPGTPPTKPVSNEVHESNVIKPEAAVETSKAEPTADKIMIDMLKHKTTLSSARQRAPPTRKARLNAAGATSSTNETDDFFASSSSTDVVPSISPVNTSVIPPSTTIQTVSPPAPVAGLLDANAANPTAAHKINDLKQKKKISLFDSDDSDIDELLFGSIKKNKSPGVSKSTTTPSKALETTVKSSVLSLDDDDINFLSKRPIKKSTKPVVDGDIFADVDSKSKQTNKAKKDWSIMNKVATDDADDIFNDGSTKSSSNVKSKSTNVKSKIAKDTDDIFDDPLNTASKR